MMKVRNMGPYDPKTEYRVGDVVTFEGGAYRCVQPVKGVSPNTNVRFDVWKRLNQDTTQAIFLMGGGSVDEVAREQISQLSEEISCDEPYKQLVTDGEGKTAWDDRLAWKDDDKVEITWDGDIEDLYTIQVGASVYLVQVTDDVFTEAQIKNGIVTELDNGVQNKYVLAEKLEESSTVITEQFAFFGIPGVFFVYQDNTEINDGLIIEHKGVYFIAKVDADKIPLTYISNFTSSFENIHPIPEEYLPPVFLNGMRKVIFTIDENGYSCNIVTFAEFDRLIKAGAPVQVNYNTDGQLSKIVYATFADFAQISGDEWIIYAQKEFGQKVNQIVRYNSEYGVIGPLE